MKFICCLQDYSQICFNEKVNIDVMEMFQCRMSLHRRAYSVYPSLVQFIQQHKTNRIIDHMLIEAMMIAEQHGFAIQTAVFILFYLIHEQKGPIPLSLACTNLDAYIRATDYLILVLLNIFLLFIRKLRIVFVKNTKNHVV